MKAIKLAEPRQVDCVELEKPVPGPGPALIRIKTCLLYTSVFAIPTITVNIGSCITQSWVAWGLAYTKVESRDFLKLSIPNAYLTGVIQYVAAFILLGGLGAAWFI